MLPPISKLDKNAAMYHFMTGFTSKVAGTERGIKEPQPTFSSLFGEPFMPLDPNVYAKMLGEKIEHGGVRVYLINTGWTGGSYGTGTRIKLAYTRKMVEAAQSGIIDDCEFVHDERFNLDVPTSCPGLCPPSSSTPATPGRPRRLRRDGREARPDVRRKRREAPHHDGARDPCRPGPGPSAASPSRQIFRSCGRARIAVSPGPPASSLLFESKGGWASNIRCIMHADCNP